MAANDVVPILGEGATSQMSNGGQVCMWRSADGHHKLRVETPESTRQTPEYSYNQFKTGPHTGWTPAEEKGIGDEAVSGVTSYGIEIMALKNHRILHLQYYTGSKPSSEMLDKLRPLAKKAADAF